MERITITSFAHFFEQIEKNDYTQTIYRGEPENSTPLIPKLGRLSAEKKRHVLTLEKKLFEAFKVRAERYLTFQPATKIEWLALAQHFGLPTRLLDWTESPLVAAFFATRKNCDGYVYSTVSVKELKDAVVDPFAITEPSVMRVPARFDRIQHQLGLFTIDSSPLTAFSYGRMRQIKIPVNLRLMFLDILCKSGVTDESLLPGLEGLARYVSLSRGY